MTRCLIHRVIYASILLSAGGSSVLGQSSPPSNGRPILLNEPILFDGVTNNYRPIDQSVEDVGALSSSLRLMPADLHVPSGFDAVYRVPGRPDLLMRIDGALHAVFRESVYAQGSILIPNDTVFFIGEPVFDVDGLVIGGSKGTAPNVPFRVQPRSAAQPVSVRAETRPSSSLQTDAFFPNDTTTSPPSVATNDRYRQMRVQELIARASAVARSNDS